MKKIMVELIFFVLTAGSLFTSCSNPSQETGGAKSGQERAILVTVADVMIKEMPVEIRTFGNVKAQKSVQIKAEVDGILSRVHFQKGQNIRQGDLLFSIDPRSYNSALDQAKANLVRDRALEENAVLNAKRSKQLLEQDFISRSDKDKAQSDARALSAMVKADEAAITNAKLQVERCSIRSPINGRVGDLLVHEGSLIKANDVPMVTINQIHPIEVFFSIPQADLPAVRNQMGPKKLKVRVSLPQVNSLPEEGELFFVDNAIEKGTGTVQLAGLLSNDRELLWPGQYVNVTLVLSTLKDALLVPSVAVQTGQEGKFVFVAKPDDTVEVRPVSIRLNAGAETVIGKGLRPGERVVTDGQLGLVPGAKIEIKNNTQPNNKSPKGRL